MIFKKPTRKINKVYIHCSASDVKAYDNIETIREWHVEGNGWSDVGYHIFIRKDGTKEEGRPLEEIPSAQKGHNTGSIAICLSGLHIDLFTQKQFESLVELCKEINQAYNKELTFHGHCEVSDKECPVFDYKKILNLDEKGYIIPLPLTPLPLSNVYVEGQESPEILEIKSTNLSTQPEKKMSISLLFLAAPLIKKLAIKGFDKLKGKVLDKVKETVVKKILEKTGINLSDTLSEQEAQSKIDQAMNSLSPEQLLELKKEIIESESELLKAELENQTEQMATVNQTMRLEMQSDDKFLKRSRPTNIYCFAFSMTIFFVSFAIISVVAVLKNNADMVENIVKLAFSLLGIVSAWAAIVGVNINSRGKEKIERLKKL